MRIHQFRNFVVLQSDPLLRRETAAHLERRSLGSLVLSYRSDDHLRRLVELVRTRFAGTFSSNRVYADEGFCDLAPIDLSPCAPRWLYFTWAIGLFIYQSLDAIDGKQARRTGTSGPLGELFDHGCDALNTTVRLSAHEVRTRADSLRQLEVILSASALNLGLSWWTGQFLARRRGLDADSI